MRRPTEDYATMGLNALKRAARKAFEKARQNNLEVPIWKDGKSAAFRTQVALEAIKGEEATSQIASGFSIHPAQVRKWKMTDAGECFQGI
jgi:hypothetical protein